MRAVQSKCHSKEKVSIVTKSWKSVTLVIVSDRGVHGCVFSCGKESSEGDRAPSVPSVVLRVC